jgi:hypothetical protein
MPRLGVDDWIRRASGRPAPAGDSDEEDEDGGGLSPAARVAASGGFDGDAGRDAWGQRPVERHGSSTIDASIRGALIAKRQRRIWLGGGA